MVSSYDLVKSKAIGIVTSKPFTVSSTVLACGTDHLVQFWSDLNAASQTHEARVRVISGGDTSLFDIRLPIQHFEPGVWNVNGALGAVHTLRVVVIRYLMGLHLVLLVTTTAISPNAWHSMSFECHQEALAGASGDTTWLTIERNIVDPDQMVGNLDTTVRISRSHDMAAAKHFGDLT